MMISPDMISPVMMILKKHDDGQPACMDTSFTTRAAETTADPNYGVWNRRDDQVAPAEILKAAQDTRRFIHEKTDDCLEAHSFFVQKKRESATGTTPPAKQKKKRKLTDEAKRRLELQHEWSICCDACAEVNDALDDALNGMAPPTDRGSRTPRSAVGRESTTARRAEEAQEYNDNLSRPRLDLGGRRGR